LNDFEHFTPKNQGGADHDAKGKIFVLVPGQGRAITAFIRGVSNSVKIIIDLFSLFNYTYHNHHNLMIAYACFFPRPFIVGPVGPVLAPDRRSCPCTARGGGGAAPGGAGSADRAVTHGERVR